MPPHTRSRTGCLTCRDEGYKCDEAKPHCGRCVRLGKTCKGYGLRVRWKSAEDPTDGGRITKKRSSKFKGSAGSRKATSPLTDEHVATPSSMTVTSTSNPDGLIFRNPSYLSPDISPMNRYLLHHWNESLAKVISMASGVRNPFLVHLTPMMPRSTALLFAISSMAAGHLAILRNDCSLKALSSHHMLVALTSLRESIQTENPELSLATILMLQISDRLFNTDSQIDHLAGAKAVIMHAGGPATWNTTSAQFLLSLCFYHDVMSSISRASSPLLSMTNVAPLEGLQSLAKLTSVVSLVSTISKMQGQGGDAHQKRGFSIKRSLEQVSFSNEGDSDIEHTIQAYKHAAIVYLYRVWDDGGSSMKPYYAEQCIYHLLKVPITSSFVSAHAWPLWTGGCESVETHLRQMVLVRIRAMYQNRRLPSLQRVQEDMEQVWQVKDAQRLQFGTENVDCCKMILHTRHREADLV
ncbi:hypothetical protein CORC01_12218 [Colletotrichum orchidophilum]|uniref:Zn(2)-C6 fungal-type domain-containing protein n=1 Tax=Colletotrichum orchidophilum TaxID=1209926 RepID=A0A1G4ATK2_9PEZI|nr:uncharacterized protein CORC01_12218 [Colletotrichum orchidophilum]OHE92500.1 hypothetical protein CORC01_12218 [Colletotrichum orchidophilum]